MSKGTLLVLTGASSVGKGAIRDCLLEDESLHLFYSISMTTRPQKGNGKGRQRLLLCRPQDICGCGAFT